MLMHAATSAGAGAVWARLCWGVPLGLGFWHAPRGSHDAPLPHAPDAQIPRSPSCVHDMGTGMEVAPQGWPVSRRTTPFPKMTNWYHWHFIIFTLQSLTGAGEHPLSLTSLRAVLIRSVRIGSRNASHRVWLLRPCAPRPFLDADVTSDSCTRALWIAVPPRFSRL